MLALPFSRGGDIRWIMVLCFFQRQGQSECSASDVRQQRLFLRLAATEQYGGSTDHCGGKQGRSGERASGLLQHHTHAQEAEIQAAVGFGQNDTGPAHFGHLLPQLRGIADGVARVAQLAQRGHRRMPGKEIPCGVL